ncbi:uncharacterized protein Z519_03561 [Cladophialophora bantiana CBS 173.52]|uniref:Phosphoribosylaminoimidazole-succinocarboxamide synthase n=1 Tax=Cladophialophora bantiana (strain ATCC 10958 / CBS 173.52 / CDC B-1940 / NIH 8579) TaxID=1442370 RepID=A0A0D2GDQ9_CLAB1|nr:uncharacterized protein Z519_03561 [Cladophialophora bantiana CBS 173.52]KIW96492.1 hypothetical protein Z519_03561 [Cladophialophora bantiana CBS 173.52]
MNLVTDPNAHIQTVKRTTPQYIKSDSLKSSSATNEYFSDYASEVASQKSDASKASYETPPSRISTPLIQHNPIDSEMTLPSRPGAIQPAPLNIRHNQNIGAQTTVRMLSSFDEMSPPTPGVDDTPYIRFAIEQLTRDEDVIGRGRDSTFPAPNAPLPAPLPPMEPGFDESPRARTPSPPPPPPPPQPASPRPPSRVPSNIGPQEVMIPVDLSKDLRMRLGYVPLPLRLPILGLYFFLCLLMIAALIFSLVFAGTNHALFDYDGNTTPRYFVFQYLPQLVGILLILWLFVIEAAVYRSLPYYCMGPGRRNRWALQNMRVLPANYLLPDFTFFRNSEPVLGMTFLIFWMTSFTVPLLACVFQTQWITDDGPARFRWTTVRGVGWTLLALYILLGLGLLYCAFRFRRRNSNLLWDPCSLADLICLFQRSNVGSDFEQSEISPQPNGQIPPRNLRLGFFTTSERPEVFHGVGEEYAPVKRLSFPPEKPKAIHPSNELGDVEAQRHSYGSAFSRNIHSPFVRYRWTPWFLRDSFVLAWIVAAVLLVIAFLVVSFVNKAVQDGFRPLLPSLTDSSGFSPANFLYSFLPAFLGMVLFLTWQPIDMYYRAVQPFRNLSQPTGATAGSSLLLSYPAYGHVRVIIRALINRDYKVAYVTFIALLSLSIPVLAGGVFTAVFFSSDNQVRIVASMPGYIALCVLVTIYAFSYLFIWPTRKRYLPHNIDTLAALLSWLYASPLLGDVALQNIGTKVELVERLTGSPAIPTSLTGDAEVDEKSNRPRRAVRRLAQDTGMRYAFGIFVGRDGKEHLGIDRLQRPGSREMLVVPTSQ